MSQHTTTSDVEQLRWQLAAFVRRAERVRARRRRHVEIAICIAALGWAAVLLPSKPYTSIAIVIGFTLGFIPTVCEAYTRYKTLRPIVFDSTDDDVAALYAEFTKLPENERTLAALLTAAGVSSPRPTADCAALGHHTPGCPHQRWRAEQGLR